MRDVVRLRENLCYRCRGPIAGLAGTILGDFNDQPGQAHATADRRAVDLISDRRTKREGDFRISRDVQTSREGRNRNPEGGSGS